MTEKGTPVGDAVKGKTLTYADFKVWKIKEKIRWSGPPASVVKARLQEFKDDPHALAIWMGDIDAVIAFTEDN